jgi:coproporphyrinogen III oxidase-like Fe-S oxidoreductase
MNAPETPSSDLALPDLTLYVRWPFRISKCPYCDFNSHVRADVDQAAWWAARFADLAAGRVNGVSLGLQALVDAALRFLARGSFDLIYARPGQSPPA